ncbi:Peptidase-M1 domain-containing protein [Sulfidibacter corallicola]|uniref:Peptidase M1 membrane alanine aminopeptidase domain-containing protein n=1 Tax=Sulfidibacter corallicola TaxID=2818388 RepID=A0A8A4TKX2_SULCO|nr:M1 family aminopeptidase [Sulfidibacter corallicola]QTD50606.1 hypothetical protein J3U87_33900 [Sulfidibacter corallicola]
MFAHVFLFEVKFQSRQPLMYIAFGILFFLAFLVSSDENAVLIGMTPGLQADAPLAVVQALGTFSVIAVLLATALAASPVLRDFDLQAAELFFTTRVGRGAYLLGRFWGAFTCTVLAYGGAILAVWLGLTFVDMEGPRSAAYGFAYLFGIGVMAIPNLWIMCAFFFCLTTLTRNRWMGYVAALGLLMLFTVMALGNDPKHLTLTALADPFGTVALAAQTRYWTAFEAATLAPSLSGPLALNRLIWLGFSTGCLFLAYRFAPFGNLPPVGRGTRTVADSGDDPVPSTHLAKGQRPRFENATEVHQWMSQTRLEMAATFKSLAFWFILGMAVLTLLLATTAFMTGARGAPLYPTTANMLDSIRGVLSVPLLLVVIYYGAEMVFRERHHRVAEITDALPYPNWVMPIAKLTALLAMVATMLSVCGLTAVTYQYASGYPDVEWGLYLGGLLGNYGAPFYLLCALAIFLQVVGNHRFLGMFLMLLYVVGQNIMDGLDFRHHLLRLTLPRAPYSDLNGFGHFLEARLWFVLLWSLGAVLLMGLVHLLWMRGTEDRRRFIGRLHRKPGTPLRVLFTAAGTAFLATAAFIGYNVYILNDYQTTRERQALDAEYEKRYAQYANLIQPRVTSVEVKVDLYPAARDLEVSGRYRLEHQGAEPIDSIHLSLPRNPDLEMTKLVVSGAEQRHADPTHGYVIHRFDEPMQPGEIRDLEFALRWDTRGFVNDGSSRRLVHNGTFLLNREIMPLPGYQRIFELEDPKVRREHGLPPAKPIPDIEDPGARDFGGLSGVRFQRVRFEAVIGTEAGQIAIAPGRLVKRWQEGDRNYFQYRSEAPILDLLAFLSADYQIQRGRWEEVDLEIYHHHGHGRNNPILMDAMKRSLAYFSEHFAPYPYRQMRIVEFPGYQVFAQAFANTVPYSERFGFTTDQRDPDDLNFTFFVTAHEIAHQWWGHQVMSADVAGAPTIVESLAEYSAWMVTQETFGRGVMPRYLRYELDRYLRGRGGETVGERPLSKTYDQSYIHYGKGSMALYGLQAYIGEAAVNRALRKFHDRFGFREAPYPTTEDLLGYLRAETPAELQDWFTDTFERIVLYDVKVSGASCQKLDSGRFRVRIEMENRVLDADSEGREMARPHFLLPVEIGLFAGDRAEPDAAIYHVRHLLTEADRTLEIEVDRRPDWVGIDPYHILIDRNWDDNGMRMPAD